ncbi:hypothetical protein CANCADRAFT_133457 [Tortispora caseinolytica NRRL Y-17796]|uniref:3-beta hydroxysteroid dehydrogenase/isomerase domain-containing protein n=1 Tax=Tortispora caseinolytica NRRL Y-17796 TaxID=767744 RepID=A0A1E4TBD9_9ASCO|nr:hypothetical protein CANCADRAFT_133457 [Tortispora caseinolytica NRRL Y-17796]
MKVLIFGGAGFLGKHLQREFTNKGWTVSIADVTSGDVIVDLLDAENVKQAVLDVSPDVIVHCASPPAEHKNEKLFYAVNVDGTKNVAEAARAPSVKAFVYTSSASVVFNGADLINANEDYPIANPPFDSYTDSKAKGEAAALAADEWVPTCAIRPAGIFGEHDRQVIPGMLQVMERGQTRFQIGSNNNLFDYTYAGNVAYAHILAAEALMEQERSKLARGQAFFITNMSPIPFFAMPRAIWAHCGHTPSSIIKIPKDLGIIIGGISEIVSYFTGREPGLNRFRIKFSCAVRYYSCAKAQAILGYTPKYTLEEGIKRSLAWLDETKKEK